MSFILIYLRLLINLNSTSECCGDYVHNLRSKHVIFYAADNVVFLILFLKSQLHKCYNLIQLPECLDFRDKKIVT